MENEHLSSPLDHMAGNSANDLTISSDAVGYLKEVGKWSKFLSIVGFVGIGFMVLIGLFAGTIFSAIGQGNADMPFPPFLLGGIYIVIAAIYFFPVYYLFNFSTKIQQALASRDNSILNDAFKYLKSHYKFLGIFVIITIGLYIVAFIVGLFSAMMTF